MVDGVCLFLEGKSEVVEQNLAKKMQMAAQNLDFEKAARLRDQLLAVRKIMEKQKILLDDGDIDAIGIARANYGICIEIFFIRNGKMLGRNQFLLNDEDDDEKNLITAFLKQYYNDAVDIPKEILIPEEIAEIELLQEWLWTEKKKKTKILLPKRGVKKDILTMAKENAEKYLLEQEQKLKDMKARSLGAVYDLKKNLNLHKQPMRME